MSTLSVIKRYALALYEVAEEKGELAAVSSDILFVNKLVRESDEIRSFVARKELSNQAMDTFAQTALYPHLSPLTADFIRTVVRNRRLAILPYLHEAFTDLQDVKQGRVKVVFETAQEPEHELVESVKQKLSERLAKDPVVEVVHEPKLLKGFRLIWENRLIDMSLAGRVRALRKIMKRSS